MRTGNLLLSAVHFIFAVFILSLGVFSLGLASAPHLRSMVYDYVFKNPHFFSIFGYSALALGVVIILGFYAMQRKIFYQVRMNPHDTLVDPALLDVYIKGCWKELFPSLKIESEVIIHPDQTLEILAKFPEGSFEHHKQMLKKAEKKLGHLLAKHIGYTEEFLLTVNLD